MRRLSQILLPAGMLFLTGCGDAVAEDPVDTTLPNGTTAIASTTADTTGESNSTDYTDTMADDMTAVEDPYPPTSPMFDGTTDPYATAAPDGDAATDEGDLDGRSDEGATDPDAALPTMVTNAM